MWQLVTNHLGEIAKISGYITGISGCLFGFYRFVIKPIVRHFAEIRLLISKTSEIYKEIKPNGGKSIRDVIDRLEHRTISIEEKLNLIQEVQDAFREDGPIGIFECTPEGKNLYVNRTYAKWLGVSKGDLMGFGWRNFLTSFADRDDYDHEWKQAFKEGREVRFPISFKGKEGNLYFDIHAYPITSQAGEVEKYLGILYKEDSKRNLMTFDEKATGPISPVFDEV